MILRIALLLVAIFTPWWTSDGTHQCYAFQVTTQRPLRQGQTRPTKTVLQNSKPNHLPYQSSIFASFRTALCIIPPDESWDTLQRARHFAQDQSYHQWPPAIRLFYPFCDRSQLSNVALDVAKVVEKHNIEPFSITLSQWTVMPIPNHLQNMLEDPEVDEADDDSPSLKKTEEDIAVMELIAKEERKGLEQKRKRELRLKRKQEQKLMEQGLSLEMANSTSTSQSATAVQPPKKQKIKQETLKASPLDEFNGPAMIALEPDEKSQRKLKKLRELLRHELEGESSSTVPCCTEQEENFFDGVTDFRPLIPMGAFPTIDAALAMARKLKGLWEPLTFEVTDFHFISQALGNREEQIAETQAHLNSLRPTLSGIQRQQALIKPDKQAQFGCDAVVMLMGEEIEQDDQVNELMAQVVCKEGLPGGYERQKGSLLEDDALETRMEDDDDSTRQNHMRLFESLERKLKAAEGDFEDLLDWLEGDEDEDELDIGTTLVIGRTHLFSGEARIYDCMPASSTSDEENGSFGGVPVDSIDFDSFI